MLLTRYLSAIRPERTSGLKLNLGLRLKDPSEVRVLKRWMSLLDLHGKVNGPPTRSVLAAREGGGNWPPYSRRGRVLTFSCLKGVSGPLFTPCLLK